MWYPVLEVGFAVSGPATKWFFYSSYRSYERILFSHTRYEYSHTAGGKMLRFFVIGILALQATAAE